MPSSTSEKNTSELQSRQNFLRPSVAERSQDRATSNVGSLSVSGSTGPAVAISSPTVFFFFFNDTATTEIYTLSLHDALPISSGRRICTSGRSSRTCFMATAIDRKSTRLNSSHGSISYAVFCLQQKKTLMNPRERRMPPHNSSRERTQHAIP